MIDLDSSAVPFEHGFDLRMHLEPEAGFPEALAPLADAIGRLSLGGELRLLALQEPGDFEPELRRLNLLRFWEAPDNRGQTLVLLRLEFRAGGHTQAHLPSPLASLRLRANSRAALDIVVAVDRLQARSRTLLRLGRAIQLPHEIDRPMRTGEVCRFEADASLLLSFSTGERFGVTMSHPGPAGIPLQRTVSVRGGLRAGASAGSRLRWDVRAGKNSHELLLSIQHANAVELEASFTADAAASLGSRGLPDRTTEILEALLDEETDDAGAVAEEIVEAAPELVEQIDDILAKATKARLRAALEAAFSTKSSDRMLLEATVDLDRSNALAVIRRLGSGDVSPMFESHEAIVDLSGSLRDEVRNRSLIQMSLSSPRGSLKSLRRSEIRTRLERRFRLDDEGVIRVDLHVSGAAEAERDRWGESLETLFEIALSGTSNAEGDTQALSLRTLRWNLVIADETASRDELRHYLSLIEALGFASADGWKDLAELPHDPAGMISRLQLTLDLKIDPAGIAERLRAGNFDENLRESLRRAYLLGQLARNSRRMLDLAWAYWTRESASRWRELRRTSIDSVIVGETVRIEPVRTSPLLSVRAPERIDLSHAQRVLLDRLYNLEERVVESLIELSRIARHGGSSAEASRAMGAFIGAARGFDAADGAPETIYYVLDALLPRARRQPPHLVVTVTTDAERWRSRIPLRRTGGTLESRLSRETPPLQ